ncbi:hypothetical protein [Chondromyces crocatus]|uniref:N-acetyltransferase domain-containing protein n=1 Tax=Chondromyces crocatus TaxID=52 RepID=A0A0K1EP34_CHOCO|nr:hypothetical protein [Chondromyces crocatus]AKT42606.1 uncharacterized protein CMC5_068330 [Chondromyces crocatus]
MTRGATIRFRPAEIADAAALAPRLIEQDLLEIAAVSGETPLVVLEEGIGSSWPVLCVETLDGLPLAVFGVVPAREPGPERAGSVWFLATSELSHHGVAFVRASRFWLAHLHEHYDVLWNYADARNPEHLRWLQWCGFAIGQRIENYGVEKRTFIEITSRMKPAPR